MEKHFLYKPIMQIIRANHEYTKKQLESIMVILSSIDEAIEIEKCRAHNVDEGEDVMHFENGSIRNLNLLKGYKSKLERALSKRKNTQTPAEKQPSAPSNENGAPSSANSNPESVKNSPVMNGSEDSLENKVIFEYWDFDIKSPKDDSEGDTKNNDTESPKETTKYELTEKDHMYTNMYNTIRCISLISDEENSD